MHTPAVSFLTAVQFFSPPVCLVFLPSVEKCMSSMQMGTQMVKLRGGSKGLVRFFYLDEHKSCIRWRPSRKNEKAKSEYSPTPFPHSIKGATFSDMCSKFRLMENRLCRVLCGRRGLVTRHPISPFSLWISDAVLSRGSAELSLTP